MWRIIECIKHQLCKVLGHSWESWYYGYGKTRSERWRFCKRCGSRQDEVVTLPPLKPERLQPYPASRIVPSRVFKPEKTAKAIHQDVGKFIKHGKQSKEYRKSVKAKVKPEEDEEGVNCQEFV